jgi:hypothetical protein
MNTDEVKAAKDLAAMVGRLRSQRDAAAAVNKEAYRVLDEHNVEPRPAPLATRVKALIAERDTAQAAAHRHLADVSALQDRAMEAEAEVERLKAEIADARAEAKHYMDVAQRELNTRLALDRALKSRPAVSWPEAMALHSFAQALGEKLDTLGQSTDPDASTQRRRTLCKLLMAFRESTPPPAAPSRPERDVDRELSEALRDWDGTHIAEPIDRQYTPRFARVIKAYRAWLAAPLDAPAAVDVKFPAAYFKCEDRNGTPVSARALSMSYELDEERKPRLLLHLEVDVAARQRGETVKPATPCLDPAKFIAAQPTRDPLDIAARELAEACAKSNAEVPWVRGEFGSWRACVDALNRYLALRSGSTTPAPQGPRVYAYKDCGGRVDLWSSKSDLNSGAYLGPIALDAEGGK